MCMHAATQLYLQFEYKDFVTYVAYYRPADLAVLLHDLVVQPLYKFKIIL